METEDGIEPMMIRVRPEFMKLDGLQFAGSIYPILPGGCVVRAIGNLVAGTNVPYTSVWFSPIGPNQERKNWFKHLDIACYCFAISPSGSKLLACMSEEATVWDESWYIPRVHYIPFKSLMHRNRR